MVSGPQVARVLGATSSEGHDVVDSVSTRLATDVAHVGGCKDAGVALLSLASRDACVLLAHAQPRVTMTVGLPELMSLTTSPSDV